MAGEGYARVLTGARRVRLGAVETRETFGLDKGEALKRIERLGDEFEELGGLLATAGQHALLVVVQGQDASGKDGAIRSLLDHSSILNVRVEPFKAPTADELAHDFLWRIHARVPGKGHIAFFNRSHYEDVIAARVLGVVTKDGCRARYEHINAFERLLGDSGVILVKLYLHVGREQRIERLIEREKDRRTAWKLNANDWIELTREKEVRAAYEDALNHCSTPEHPFHLVPGDYKWARDVAVLDAVVAALRPRRKSWLGALQAMREKALPEVRAIRRRLGMK
jgi:polyphosphate kinase 2 (PPK2 family)